MRLTVKTNLAMRTLMYCAVHRGRVVRKSEIARACNASPNHIGHVINKLSQIGFIETLRGRGGGLRLAIPPESISVGRVFRLFEANVPFAECFSVAENHCPITAACRLRGAISNAIEAFYAALDDVTLADLVQGNHALDAILAQHETA